MIVFLLVSCVAFVWVQHLGSHLFGGGATQ